MATYLVTGGDGFIGSHLVERLLNLGERVRVLDNLVARSGENLDYLKTKSEGRLEAVTDDIRDPDVCLGACQGVEAVFHLAALGSVPRSIDDPVTTHQTNATGSLNMMLAAHRAGVKRFVWSSSSSVYGDQAGLAKHEAMSRQPISPYGVSKAASEMYGLVFQQSYGLPTVALRFFNVFGPRQDPAGDYAAVIPKFITLMLNGQRPTIFGDGRQSRDFTYVDNVVEACLLAAQSTKAPGRMINIAAGESHDLIDLVARLNGLLGTDLQPILAASRPGEIIHSQADISLAAEALDFNIGVDYQTGLAKTVDYYRSLRS